MNIKIAPSILSADFANLERDIRKIDTADYVHVDIMDGEFVPNISIGIPVVKAIRPVTGLPLDVHLMITKPVRYVEQFCDAGADLVTVHVESDFPENIHAALEKIHAKGKRAGIVLKPNTRAEAALPYLKECDIVLVMTVEPGFGGQKFMADMMPKVAQLRAMLDEVNPDCELEVDGGVDTATRDACVNAGANVLVAGSAVYKAADIPAKIKALRGLTRYGVFSRSAGKAGRAIRAAAGHRRQERAAAGVPCAEPDGRGGAGVRRRHRGGEEEGNVLPHLPQPDGRGALPHLRLAQAR